MQVLVSRAQARVPSWRTDHASIPSLSPNSSGPKSMEKMRSVALRSLVGSSARKSCCRTTDVEIRVPNSQWIFAGEAQYAGGFRSFRPEKARTESYFWNPSFNGRRYVIQEAMYF